MKSDQTVFLKTCETLPFIEMRKASSSTACYHAHSHDEFSFGVIDKGAAEYINLNQKHHIKAGHTVTINPDESHSCNPSEGKWSYRMLFINTHWIGKLQSEIHGLDNIDYQLFTESFNTHSQYYNYFDKLFEVLSKESNPLQAEEELICFLSGCFAKKNAHKIQPNKIGLQKINELLIDELDINHSLNDLSKLSGLSRYHLIRSFKHVYGLSPHALQLDERIKKAKNLLKSGHAITEVSSNLGFSDQSHFQRNFKKRLALTPKQYQAFFI